MIPQRIRYLLGSPERVRLLDGLADGPTRQCALGRECSVARSTVHRNLEGFEERGWVVRTDEGYALTAAGERILDAYRSFARTVDTLTDHEPVLQHLRGVEERLPPGSLVDCQTTVRTEKNPHAPTVSAAAVIRANAGERIRVAVSNVSPITNRAGWEAVEAGSDVETVVDPATFDTLRSDYGETVAAAREHDRISIRVSDDPIETGVVLAGEEVCVVVRDGSGTAEACLTGSNPELRGWAERAYDRVRPTTPTPGDPGAVSTDD